MKHYIYPENQYMHIDRHGRFTVDYDHEREEFKLKTLTDGVKSVTHLSAERAAMLAGFILSKQRAIVQGDAMAFSSVTRACDAIPKPDFTVIGQGELAPTEEQDTKDDDQDVKVTVTSPDPESAERATDAFAAHLSNKWVAKDASLPDTTHPSPLLTEAQHEELRRLQAAAPADDSAVVSRTWVAKDDDQDLGLLHPDQERRLTALREAAEILAGPGRLTHDRLIEWAEWILDGNIGKED